MAISFQSDEEVLRKLRDKLRRMTDEELIRFGKEVRRLADNPFQRQLEEARAEWKRRKLQSKVRMAERRKTVFVSPKLCTQFDLWWLRVSFGSHRFCLSSRLVIPV
jgi:hypothetical protein